MTAGVLQSPLPQLLIHRGDFTLASPLRRNPPPKLASHFFASSNARSALAILLPMEGSWVPSRYRIRIRYGPSRCARLCLAALICSRAESASAMTSQNIGIVHAVNAARPAQTNHLQPTLSSLRAIRQSNGRGKRKIRLFRAAGNTLQIHRGIFRLSFCSIGWNKCQCSPKNKKIQQ